MADPALPFILAGPILRRVEPRLVTVWMALSEPRAVQLNVFDGRQQTGTGKFVFLGAPLVRGAANTFRFGAKLHIGVVVAEIGGPPAQPLTPGLNYSYNVLFAPFVGSPDDNQGAKLDPASLQPNDDLKKRGLLLNAPVEGKPHQALGYDEGELPGFALPPPALTDLRMLHGSCRRPGFAYVEDDGTKSFDALALVDDLILEWRRGTAEALPFDANVRPHQLFFTGDQIYADDVSTPLLPMLNRVARALIGGREILPTRYPPANDDPSREGYVNAPKPLPDKFKTLQEFVNDRRSPAKKKDPLAELKLDRRVQTLQDPCFDRAFQIVYPVGGYKVDDLKSQTDAEGFRHWEVDLVNFPAGLRRPIIECEAQFSTGGDSHLMSFGEFCAMYLAVWCNAVWELGADGKPKLAGVDEIYSVPNDPLPQIWELTACFPDEATCTPRSDRTALEKYMQDKRTKKKADFDLAHATLTTFYDSLPRVRRALANVPTYMVFDDHDVTDDWNLGRAWRDRVFTSHMGRHIITNALVAYIAFQDWGNDPLRYREPPFSSALALAGGYQPTIGIPTEKGSTTIVQHALQTMFGLDQLDPEKPAPQLKWHFTIDGPRHRVVMLDTRTRRSFPSRYLPAGLLSAKALAEQLPDPRDRPLPPGVDVLVVVSQTPPVLPAIASRVLIPVLNKVEEFKHHDTWRRLTGLEPDDEIWPGEEVSYQAFLRRLAEYKKVVVLSGEVHYASAGELTLWKRGLKRLTLAAPLEADLNTTQKPPMATPRLLSAFRQAGFNVSGNTCVQVRPGNDEWLVVDVDSELMFLARKEVDGLNVYEEELPARLAQFVSSGLKNVKKEIFKLGRLLGFAFPLTDLTPAERLIWDDNTPEPIKPPADGRFPPAVRDRLGQEPVVVPAGNWPPGTTLVSRPDVTWRADAIQDRRPDAERPEFTRPAPLPEFDPQDVEGSYSEIAKAHSGLPDKFRFTRGVLTQSNVGLIRFELEDERLIARQDLVSHPPGKNEAAVVNVYRIPLEVFGLERPKLTFDLPVENGSVSVLKFIVKIGKKIVHKIEDILDTMAEDALVARGLEADLGLPAGTLEAATKTERPDLSGIDAYLEAIDADDEKRDAAIEALKAYAKFITTFMDAAKTNDPSIIVDETLYRFFQFMTVDLIKFEHPRLYAWMRLLGAINADARLTLEETFAPEVPKSIFSGDYWDRAPAAFVRGYQNFRLDQAHDFVLQDPGLNPNLTEDQRVELRQLGVELFGFSDGGFIILAFLLWLYEKKHPDGDVTIEQLYSWELPYHEQPPLCIEPTGETGIPISDHIASRAYTTRISTKTGEPAKRSATLTQVLLRDRDGDLGWLFSLRGAVTFEDKRGSKERPVKATITIAATDGLDVFVKFAGDDQLSFTGSAAAGMKIAIQPEKPSTVAPAIALPDGKGTRLEIGDYSFSLELSKDGFKVKLSLKKSAFVFGGEGDAFMKEVLGSQERRVEFDLGITADQNGVSVDGGGRLSTTLSLNRTIGPVTVKTVQLALVPDGDDKSSELAFSAVASFVVKIKAVTFVVEQIGFTINVGSTSDPPPPDALTMASGLLYVRELGFKPPAGLGITVEGDFVNGGGFLFHDRDHDEYAGVLQLDFGPRFTFTAIGLLTTKLPDGREGYTFLIILSLELDPAWRIGPLAISGLGGLFGLRRALDTDALRAGLRNRTLDAVLFPKDPVANAGRLIAALRTVFPPAIDRHVAGPILQLSLGVPEFLTAELGLIFEWGASSRRALIGQLHLALPPRVGPKVVEINIDAAGIWDGDAFSLDATIYDSHIACVHISGDVAFRMKSGDSSFFLLSLGGYHPEFNAPATFPKLQRMKVALAETDNFRLVLTGYFALTSNTKQFGADLDFKVGGAGISVEARLSFDALFDKNAGFIIDFDLEVKVKYKGKTFFGVSASGRFTGPEPKRVKGEWTLDLWLFSITRPFEKVLGDDAPPVDLPVVDPLPDLVAALKNPQSWSAPLPGSSRMLVSFRNRPGSPEVLIHPLGEIGVRQQLLPLGIELDLYGGGVVSGKRSFSITKAFVGKDELPAPPVVNEQFAAGDFLQLSDDEKLHRKSFEAMPAGVRLQPKALAFGGQAPGTAGQEAVSEIDFEEIVVDADGNVVRQTKPKTLGPLILTFAVAFGPAAKSQLRAGGAERFAATGPAFRVGEERFTVAKTDDLDPVDIAGMEGRSEAAVRQALERHLRENPQDRGALQVVPAFRAEVPA